MSDDQNIVGRPQKKVEPYQPKELGSQGIRINEFNPQEIRAGRIENYSQTKKHFGAFASTDQDRTHSREMAHFNLHPESKRLLGVDQEERNHLEDVINQEVKQRLETFRVDAYQEGFAQGVKDGKIEAERKSKEAMEPMFQRFTQLLAEFDGIKQDMYSANEKTLIQVIYSIAREVTLKEIKADPNYLKRLSLLVIQKMGIKDFVKIKISRNDLGLVDEIKDFLRVQMPDLRNIQIEPADDLELGGCKIETDLIKVDAAVSHQLKSIEESLQGESH